MARFSFVYLLLCSCILHAQENHISGIVQESNTHEPLAGASITLYEHANILGSISNSEGRFFINNAGNLDSARFSMIGYRSRVFTAAALLHLPFITIALETEAAALAEVVVKPLTALDIVRHAAQRLPTAIPVKDFESTAFYREIIRDSQRYYSVAEAIFSAQFFVQKKAAKLKLDKGRSKEDVAFTRLFEDFHPGGGPEDAVGQSPVIHHPDFLNVNSLGKYVFKKDSTIRRDDHLIYVIGFDQRPGLHEALEKGRIFIDADDFSLLKYEARNSPSGTPYIKSLRGTDKVFAEILHIEFLLKGWARAAEFTMIGDRIFLAHADMSYYIGYRQPKKEIDLDLSINTELLVTDFQHPIVKEISKGEEWKRKNLVANLPSDFDTTFWGANNILSPTTEIKNIIDSLSRKNGDVGTAMQTDGWEYLNKDFFIAYKKSDSMILVPVVKCSWDDDQAGGMIYKNTTGDFNLEAKLQLSKRSNASIEPDNGFQQSGLIIRNASGKQENSLIFSLGTGGNDKPKYFVKRTTAGKTKTIVDKTGGMNGWLRLQKKGNVITVYKKANDDDEWTKVDDYEFDWLKGELQAGCAVMARFAGDGPKQKPDMKAVFTNLKITTL